MTIHRSVGFATFALVFLTAALLGAAEPLDWIPLSATRVTRIAPVNERGPAIAEFTSSVAAVVAKLAPDRKAGWGLRLVEDSCWDSPAAFPFETLREAPKATAIVDRSAPIYHAYFHEPSDVQYRYAEAIFFQSKAADPFDALAQTFDKKWLRRTKAEAGFERFAVAGEQTRFVAKRGEWIVVAMSEAAYDALRAAEGKPETLAALDAESQRLLTSGHVGHWYNLEKRGQAASGDVDAGLRETLGRVASLPDSAFGSPDAARATRGLYQTLLHAGVQTAADSRWSTTRIAYDRDGIEIESLVRFVEDAAIEKWLPPASANSMELLESLPDGAPIYVGLAFDPQAFSIEQIERNSPGEAELRKRAGEFWKAVQNCGLGEAAVAVWLPDRSTGFTSVHYQRAKKPAELLAGVRRLFAAETRLETGAGAIRSVLEPELESHRDRAIDRLTVTSPLTFSTFDSSLDGVVQSYLERLKLSETYRVRLAPLDDVLVQAVGDSPDAMKRAIDGYDAAEGTLGQSRPFGATRERLANDCHVFVAMDFPAVARNVLGTFFSAEQQAGLGAMFNLAELPPSYLGLTAAVEKDGARLKAFLPVAQVGGVLAMLPK